MAAAAYDDRMVKARLAQAFGRLIRREGDKGLFVVLSSAFPSRLLSAFPPEVQVSRVKFDVALNRVRLRLFPEGGDQFVAQADEPFIIDR